jgi:hypothetical protein
VSAPDEVAAAMPPSAARATQPPILPPSAAAMNDAGASAHAAGSGAEPTVDAGAPAGRDATANEWRMMGYDAANNYFNPFEKELGPVSQPRLRTNVLPLLAAANQCSQCDQSHPTRVSAAPTAA